MLFGDMVERVQFTLGASEIEHNDEREIIKDYLNEGIVDVIARTRPYARVINMTAIAGTKVHDLASTVIALMDVELPGYGFLRRYSRQDIADAQAAAGYGFAYEEPLLWISPVFSKNTVIRTYGCFRPTRASADDADLANPTFGGLAEEFHPALINYALWKMGEYVQHQGSGEGEKWRIAYEGQDTFGGDIAKIKRILGQARLPRVHAPPQPDPEHGGAHRVGQLPRWLTRSPYCKTFAAWAGTLLSTACPRARSGT